jgi:alanine-synthesizing transaminase
MQNKFYLTEKLPAYVFAKIHELKNNAIASGVDVLDFGMGNPDLPPPTHVMEKLSKLVMDPKLFGYSNSGGIDVLKESFCDYYKRRFNVDLDYKSETVVTIGAKEGIASLATAISDVDSYICVPTPSYPIHNFAFIISKSNIAQIPAISAKDFLERFKSFVENADKKPQAVIVSYPSNPTTELAGLDFYEELVSFCKKHQIYIISDIAYCEIYFDEKDKPHSILEVEGAKDIAIEFSTISKTYSMAGCRVGFAAGNKDLIRTLTKIKSFLDYGSFNPIQIAACDALSEKSDGYLDNLRQTYKKRGDLMTDLLTNDLGWAVERPKASMFIWTKLPPQFAHLSSMEFCEKLIMKTGLALTPGSAFGNEGEGFVRFSLIHDEENMREAIARLKVFFAQK